MEIVLLTAAGMALIMLAMAVGVIFKRKPLKGSCGGVGGADCICEQQGTPDACADEGAPPKPGRKQKVLDDGVVVYE